MSFLWKIIEMIQMETHIDKEHAVSKGVKCTLCGDVFLRYYDLNSHLIRKHGYKRNIL